MSLLLGAISPASFSLAAGSLGNSLLSVASQTPLCASGAEPAEVLDNYYRVLSGQGGLTAANKIPPQEIRQKLFFDCTQPYHGFVEAEEIRVHARGTPSSRWDCIVEIAYQESIAVFIENPRTGNNTLFIPGRSSIAEFVKLIAMEGDLLRIHLRYMQKADDQHLEGVEKLQEKMHKVIEGCMTPWEETEVGIQIAEGTITQAPRGPLEQEASVELCRELACSPNSVVILENQTLGKKIILRHGQGNNRVLMSGFIVRQGDRLAIKTISRAARYLRDRFIAAFQGAEAPLANLEERAMYYTVSEEQHATLPIELRDRLEKHETQKMQALIRTDTGHILLYSADLPTTTHEMRDLWRLTVNNFQAPIAEALLNLEYRRFRIAHARERSINSELAHEQVESARNILLYHLLARHTAVGIMPGSDLNGATGLLIAFSEQTIVADEDPRPRREVLANIEEILHPPAPEPAEEPHDPDPEPVADVATPPVDRVAAPFVPRYDNDDYLAELARTSDPRLRFLVADSLDQMMAQVPRLNEGDGTDLVFDAAQQKLYFATYMTERVGLHTMVRQPQWPVIVENHPSLRDGDLSRWFFVTVKLVRNGERIVKLHYMTVNGDMAGSNSHEARETLERFLTNEPGRPYRVLRSSVQFISYEQHAPLDYRFGEWWRGTWLGRRLAQSQGEPA